MCNDLAALCFADRSPLDSVVITALLEAGMKKDFVKIYEDSLPLINQAIEALRRLHEAEAAGHPAE